MSEPAWTLAVDDNFVHANTSVGSGAKSKTGVPTSPSPGAANSWVDYRGNKYKISSNTVVREGGTLNWAGDGLYRDGSGESLLNCALRVNYAANSKPTSLYLRYNATSTASIWFNLANGGYVGKLTAWNSFAGNTGSFNWTYNSSHTYEVFVRVWGTNPTNWAVTITDTTDSINVVDTSGTITGAVEAAGFPVIDCGETSPGTITRVRYYSNAITLGVLDPVSSAFTTTNIGLTWGTTIGGSAPITLNLHKATTPTATIGAGTLVADVSAITPGTTYNNTPGGNPGDRYYYFLEAIDSLSSRLISYPVPAETKIKQFKLGFVGTSITEYIEVYTANLLTSKFVELFPKYLVSIVNKGKAASDTGMWLPGSSYLNEAISAFDAANTEWVFIEHGTNDARVGVARSAAQFKTNLSAICNELITTLGVKIILSGPASYRANYSGVSGYDATSFSLLMQYIPKMDELVDNVNIFKGDRTANQIFAEKANSLIGDWVHPNQAGNIQLVNCWYEGAGAALGTLPQYGINSTSGPRIFRLMDGSNL